MQLQHLKTRYWSGLLFLLVLIFSISFASASVSVGTIDPISHYSLVCHDVSCASSGNINWLPSSTSTAIVITDTSITGYAWGDEIGWINMAPTGAGVTVNPATGILYGTAFSSVSGWVNFRPTNGGVNINANGEFVGYAWVGGLYGGWIKFDCSQPASCVKTDWRPQSVRPMPAPTNTGGGILPFNTILTLGTATVRTPNTPQTNTNTTETLTPNIYPRDMQPRAPAVAQSGINNIYINSYPNNYIPVPSTTNINKLPIITTEAKPKVRDFSFVPKKVKGFIKAGKVNVYKVVSKFTKLFYNIGSSIKSVLFLP